MRTTKMKLNMRILCELNNAFNYEKCDGVDGKERKKCCYVVVAHNARGDSCFAMFDHLQV